MTVTFFERSSASKAEYLPIAVDCATRFSGVSVATISDRHFHNTHCFNSTYTEARAKDGWQNVWLKFIDKKVVKHPYQRAALIQWLCLETVSGELQFPLIVLDWDVAVGHNLVEPVSAFKDHRAVKTTSGFIINDSTVITEFCDFCSRLDVNSVSNDHLNIMMLWSMFASSANGVLSLSPLGLPYFDWNIHTHTDIWEGDDQFVFNGLAAKKIHWVDRKPFFKRLSTDSLYPAWIIHCWGSYKERMSEIRKRLLNEITD